MSAIVVIWEGMFMDERGGEGFVVWDGWDEVWGGGEEGGGGVWGWLFGMM